MIVPTKKTDCSNGRVPTNGGRVKTLADRRLHTAPVIPLAPVHLGLAMQLGKSVTAFRRLLARDPVSGRVDRGGESGLAGTVA